MADALAAIREKAQAHQEESKAKRFRDRGGLWQPLSPSKNRLVDILRGIGAETPVVEMQDELEAYPNETVQIKVKAEIKSKSKGKAKAVLLEARDEQVEVESEPVKQKGKGKGDAIVAKRKARGKALSDVQLDPAEPVSKRPNSSKRKLPHPSRESRVVPEPNQAGIVPKPRQKIAVLDEDDEKTGSSIKKDLGSQTTSGEMAAPAVSSRPKRRTKKRNLKEASDEEDEASDYRPSPAKKPRTRAPTKTSTKTKTTKVAHGAKQAVPRGKAKDETIYSEDEEYAEAVPAVSKVARAKSVHEDNEVASTSKPLVKRRRKCPPNEEQPSDEEPPFPPKRRRTQVSTSKVDPKVESKSKSKPTCAFSDTEPEDDSAEDYDAPKSRVRKKSKAKLKDMSIDPPDRHIAEERAPISKRTKTKRVSDDEDTTNPKPSAKRGRKRPLTPEPPPDGLDEAPSPQKRRRTKATPKTETKSNLAADDTASADDGKPTKSGARKSSTKSKTAVKPRSCAKAKGKSSKASSQASSDSDAQENSGSSGLGTKPKFRDGCRLSTIAEVTEDVDEDEAEVKAPSKPSRPPSKVVDADIVGQNAQKRHPKVHSQAESVNAVGGDEDSVASRNISTQNNDAVVPKVPKIKLRVAARTDTDAGVEAMHAPNHEDIGEKNTGAGRTKRRRKKVDTESDGLEGSRRAKEARADQAPQDSKEVPVEEKVKTKQTGKADSSRKGSTEISALRSLGFGGHQAHRLPLKEIELQASKNTEANRESKPKPKPKESSKSLELEDEGGEASKRSKGKLKEKEGKAIHSSKQPAKAGRAPMEVRAPPLRDVHMDAAIDSDADELDFLS